MPNINNQIVFGNKTLSPEQQKEMLKEVVKRKRFKQLNALDMPTGGLKTSRNLVYYKSLYKKLKKANKLKDMKRKYNKKEGEYIE